MSCFWLGSRQTGETFPGAARRSVRDPRQRGDAAADAGRARDPALPALALALADRRCAGRRVDGRRDPRMAGARLQPARSQPAPRCVPDRRGGLAGRPHGPARCGRLHRGGDPQLRLRRGGAARRHERGPGAGAHGSAVRAGGRPGAVRPRLNRLPGPRAALRGLPLAADCPSRGTRYEPLRKQSRFEGSFRQRRAAALRAVADGPRPLAELDAEAVAALERDGLVRLEAEVVALPR